MPRHCVPAGTSPAIPAISTPPAVPGVAVVGLPDERLGKVITAFVQRVASVDAVELDEFCRRSGLANFKRPRSFVFVEEIPKSPVGKLLRRKLVEGEYTLAGSLRLSNQEAKT